MDSKIIYDTIIENRKNNILDDNEYGEWHHIIPKSIGGIDGEVNLIRLSGREHFICHYLLSKMYNRGTNEWYKMNHAFMMMKTTSHNQTRYINSRMYESRKKAFSEVMSKSQSGKNNSQYGTVWMYSPEHENNIKVTKEKLSEYELLGYVQGRIDFKKRKLSIRKRKQNLVKREEKRKQKLVKREEKRKQKLVDRKERELPRKIYYNTLFNQFLQSEYMSIRQFANICYDKSHVSLTKNWKKYVTEYSPKRGCSYK